jgi:hypothetical protein
MRTSGRVFKSCSYYASGRRFGHPHQRGGNEGIMRGLTKLMATRVVETCTAGRPRGQRHPTNSTRQATTLFIGKDTVTAGVTSRSRCGSTTEPAPAGHSDR